MKIANLDFRIFAPTRTYNDSPSPYLHGNEAKARFFVALKTKMGKKSMKEIRWNLSKKGEKSLMDLLGI